MNTTRLRLLVTVLACAALVVGGCSLLGDDSDDEDTAALADAAAAAMTAGQMGDVAWTEDGALIHARWDQIVGDLTSSENLTLAVEASDVRVNDDDTATATLAFAWDLGGHEWAYETTLPMVKIEDQWRAEFDPAVVEPSLQDGEALAASTLDPVRADIVGTDGTALVTDRPVVRVGIDKVNVDADEVDESARSLADLVGVDADAFARRVSDAGERAFVEAITLRDEDVTTQLRRGIDTIPGARGIADEIPLAPTRTFARPLLGNVGPATAEVIETADGAIGEGDVVGLSGLQRQYDETLRGAPGIVVRAVADEENTNDASDDAGGDGGGGDADGAGAGGDGGDADDAERELFTAQPVDGTPLTVTLHAPTQILAEEVLAGADGAAALVAMRPSDGHLLAVAGTSPDGYSIATLGQYAPGSTFKTVTALALLRAGLVPESAVSCPPTITVDGYRFKNYDDYPSSALGDIDLRTAVAESCNTALIGARDTATQSALAQAAESLGLGVDHDLGFPAYLGSVPAEAEGTAHAAAMIGQGEVLASPLAMAAVAASVAAGRTVTPVLVPDAAPEPVAPPTPLTDEEAALLRDMMRAAVTDGSARFLADLPGEPVIAKTGTAEYGTGDDVGTHAWMIASRGDLAVAVFVENGESGSATAGPLLTTFLQNASV